MTPCGSSIVDYLYNTMVPHITTMPPTTSLMDDFLINVKIGDASGSAG